MLDIIVEDEEAIQTTNFGVQSGEYMLAFWIWIICMLMGEKTDLKKVMGPIKF